MGKFAAELIARHNSDPVDGLAKRIRGDVKRTGWLNKYLREDYSSMPRADIIEEIADGIGVPPFALAAAYLADRGIDSPFHLEGGVRFLRMLSRYPLDKEKLLEFYVAAMETGMLRFPPVRP